MNAWTLRNATYEPLRRWRWKVGHAVAYGPARTAGLALLALATIIYRRGRP